MTSKSNILETLTLKKTKFLKPFYKQSVLEKDNFCEVHYKIYQCLGIGGFSKVYLSRSFLDGKFYAIKFIKKHDYS